MLMSGYASFVSNPSFSNSNHLVSTRVKLRPNRCLKRRVYLKASSGSSDQSCPNNDIFDQEAFDSKNAIRKKFGLPPINKTEFLQLQAEQKQLEIETIQKQKAAAISAASSRKNAMLKREKKARKQNVLGNIFGILKDTCESNFDCQRPEVCCDLGFKKMCCSSGEQQLERIPVRVVADDDQWARGTRQ